MCEIVDLEDFPYFVYGLMGILAALFMWKFVPETKGRTLEEMENLWQVPKVPGLSR